MLDLIIRGGDVVILQGMRCNVGVKGETIANVTLPRLERTADVVSYLSSPSREVI